MKKLSFIIAILMPLLFVSCEYESDLGYPKKVSMPTDGGEITISGNFGFNHAGIHNYKNSDQGESTINEDNIVRNEYKWLRIEYDYSKMPNVDELKIYAKPNTSGKSRYLHIAIYCGPDYQNVKVVQK